MNWIATAFAVTINTNLPGTPSAEGGIAGFVINFYNFALLAAGILAFGAIVYGGFKYVTGRGNASSQSEARSWITSALLGLLLLAGAYIILYTVNPNITNLQQFTLPQLSANPTVQPSTQANCVRNCFSPNACAEITTNNWVCQPPAPGASTASKCQPACTNGQVCQPNVFFTMTYTCIDPPNLGSPNAVCKGSGVSCPSPKICRPSSIQGPGWETCEDPTP